eukprot:2784429-Pleurochrysis_carterae.AAC.4
MVIVRKRDELAVHVVTANFIFADWNNKARSALRRAHHNTHACTTAFRTHTRTCTNAHTRTRMRTYTTLKGARAHAHTRRYASSRARAQTCAGSKCHHLRARAHAKGDSPMLSPNRVFVRSQLCLRSIQTESSFDPNRVFTNGVWSGHFPVRHSSEATVQASSSTAPTATKPTRETHGANEEHIGADLYRYYQALVRAATLASCA